MSRVSITVGFLVTAFLICILIEPATFAQSLPSKKEAADMVEKAYKQLSLAGGGSPSFHLIARLHYQRNGDVQDGTYELLWASRGRFREEFHLGSLIDTDITLDDKRYTFRNTPLISYQLLEFKNLMNLPLALMPQMHPQVKKVYESALRGTRVWCMDLEDAYQGRQICLDSNTKAMVSDSFGAKSIDGRVEFEARDFLSVGPAMYPSHVERNTRNEALEVTVDKLVQASQFADSVFIPPANATASDWCPDPNIRPSASLGLERVFHAIEDRGRISNPTSITVPQSWSYYLAIAPDGRVKQSAPIYDYDKEIDAEFNHYFDSTHFSVETCGDKPIEYDKIFVFGINATRRADYLF